MQFFFRIIFLVILDHQKIIKKEMKKSQGDSKAPGVGVGGQNALFGTETKIFSFFICSFPKGILFLIRYLFGVSYPKIANSSVKDIAQK